MNEKINLTDSVESVIVTISEGNPGAINVMMQLLAGSPHGLLDVLRLEDLGFRGPKIWVAYKNACNSDIEKLRLALREHDPAMIAIVKKECP